MKTSFKALWVNNSDSDPDQTDQIEARWLDTKIEDLSEGEVIIKTQYSSVNYKDALAVTGRGKILRKLPLIPGIDLSGCVIQSLSPQFKEGDSVIVKWLQCGGKILWWIFRICQTARPKRYASTQRS